MGEDEETTEEMMDRARREAYRGITTHGSIDKWPTLSLLPNQFPVCVCGRPRSQHLMHSTDRLGVRRTKHAKICDRFEAPEAKRYAA